MNRGNMIKFIAGIGALFIVVLILVTAVSTLLNQSGTKKGSKAYETFLNKSVEEKIDYLTKSMDVTNGSPRKSSVSLEPASLYDELPDISKYPLVVQGTGEINIEICASPEKAGSGKDGWLNEIATEFNAQRFELNGKVISVSIRNVSSGQAADYIVSGKYTPDAFAPSSVMWGNLIKAQGKEVTVISDKLVGNVAGILINASAKSKLEAAYGKADMSAVLKAVEKSEMIMGYTNPLASSTGLNFLMSTLAYYDSKDLLSEQAKNGFTSFQNNVPYVAYTTMQMRESAASGKLDGMVMEYQTYVNDKQLAKYEFIPFGIRHDNPLYEVGSLDGEKKEALSKFAQYCGEGSSQTLATEYGFNGLETYQSEAFDTEGSIVLQAQKLWKANKDGGKEIIAVFVADVSGSMDGEPLAQLKKSLVNGAQYINDNNYVGLVSYSSGVTVELPVGKFDLNQRAYFQGAVEDLQALGGTATYNGITVAIDMLTKAKADHPNAKLMLFLLSDGETNEGIKFDMVEPLILQSKVPVYTIGYNEDIEALKRISNINEASSINADSDDVIYKIKSLFNAQM